MMTKRGGHTTSAEAAIHSAAYYKSGGYIPIKLHNDRCGHHAVENEVAAPSLDWWQPSVLEVGSFLSVYHSHDQYSLLPIESYIIR